MNKTMKIIVFITNNYKPYSGGVVSSIDSARAALIKQGFIVYIITLDFLSKYTETDHNIIRLYCPFKGIYKTKHIAIPWGTYVQMYTHINAIKPDIIHAHHPFLLGATGQQISRELHIPIVFTYHTMYEHYLHYMPFLQGVVKPLMQYHIRKFCNSIDGIIVPTISVNKYLQAQGIITPMQVIPSSILPLFIHPQPYKKDFKAPRFHLISVSRFVKEKNIFFLINVFAQLDKNKFQLTLLGYGSELNVLRNYTYNILRLKECDITFIEHPSKTLLAEYYAKAHLFIFASHSETQGLVLAEAMAAGTPVIALKAIGAQDIIKNGVNGFLVENMYDMQEAIENCAHHEAMYMSLVQNAWHTAQSYHPEKIGYYLINFYRNIIENCGKAT